MGNATRFAMLAACVGIASIAAPALANVISFDPDGSGVLAPINVASFDLLPGSSLNEAVIPGQVGSTATVLFQARLGSFLDGSGKVIQVPGLNDPSNANHFQITVTAQFNVTITAQTTAAGTQTTVLALAASQPTNFIHYYYSNALSGGQLTAVDLAGTGFTDGTLIANGSATSVNAVFTALTSVAPTNLDNFGNNDWAGTSTVTGVGGTSFDASISFADPRWFLSPVTALSGNTTDALSYQQADPSKKFFGTVTPNLGAINGASGPDIEFQTDGVTSFIPEPASLLLLATGAAALLSRRRK